MDWLNIHTSSIDSAECTCGDPVRRATWVWLLRYCIGQENGGRIHDCRGWGDTTWQQMCKIRLREINLSTRLWQWDGDDLVVSFYPLEQELTVKAKRLNGKSGGRPAKPSNNHVVLSRLDSAETEGKVKESKGREGNDSVADAPRPPKKKIMTVLDNPPTVEQVQAFMDQPTNDGQDWNDGILTASKYIDANLERGWLMKNGKPVVSWEAQYRNWHRMAIERGDKPSRTVRNNEDAMRSLMENQVLDLGKKRSA